jgi:hypothetical protein
MDRKIGAGSFVLTLSPAMVTTIDDNCGYNFFINF